jgi:hypothetical protein
MPRFVPLLTVIVAAALALPPSASLAQQRGRQQIPPGGPNIPSGRVLRGPSLLPDLDIVSLAVAGPLKCIRPLIAQATISVRVTNIGQGPAVMPPNMPTLGRYWVGVWSLSIVPGVMSIAAGPPAQLLPGEFKNFLVGVIVRQGADQSGVAFGVGARVDPANLILESNETNNDLSGIFTFPLSDLCQ